MKVKNQEEYNTWRKTRIPGVYPSNLVLKTVEDWAYVMERRISDGLCVEKTVEVSAKELGIDKLDQFIVDTLVLLLVKYWYYGEELRIYWTNFDIHFCTTI